MRTVLACTDFSDASTAVLDEAARLADALSARVVVLHVHPIETELDYVGVDVGYVTSVPRPTVAADTEPARVDLARVARRIETPGRQVDTVFAEGLVVDRIIEEAREQKADVLVLGSHGHGALYHLLLGSVTESVLRKIDRPVLVVPVGKKAKGKQ